MNSPALIAEGICAACGFAFGYCLGQSHALRWSRKMAERIIKEVMVEMVNRKEGQSRTVHSVGEVRGVIEVKAHRPAGDPPIKPEELR
jgi:hypothetical protein